jgi:Holliday junction resolvase RusA-like endonuclease
MNNILLYFDVQPKAVQSVRFSRKGSYQPRDVKDWKSSIRKQAFVSLKNSYPEFQIFKDKPLGVSVTFGYAPLKSWSKKKRAEFDKGNVIYKDTSPDLTDNLMKGFIDALKGIIWKDDSIICHVGSRKIFDLRAGIMLKVWEL